MMYRLLPFVLSASLTSTLLIPRQSTNTTQACNSSPALCSKSYSAITHLGAHDSPFLRSGSGSTSGLSISEAGNQNVDSIKQLDLGARLLSAQVHRENNEWHLCHSSCSLLDAGTLSSWLSGIKTWLDSHPNDVVTILLVNSDNATPTDLAAQFTAVGIEKYGYTPTTPGTWPTLQNMISANTRLVTFVTPLTTTTSSSSTSYLLSQFDYVFENPYNVTAPTGFTCTQDRPAGNAATSASAGKLPLMNHMLYTSMSAFGNSIQTPDFDVIETTNAATGAGSLGDSATQCTTEWGRQPWAVLVDGVDVGDTVKVVDGLNGVTAPDGRASPPVSFEGGAGKTSPPVGKGLLGMAVAGACALLMSC